MRATTAFAIAAACLIAAWALPRQRIGRTTGGAYPFPTAASHESAPLDDAAALEDWAGELGASAAEVRRAASVVGGAKAAIADYLGRAG